MRAFLFYLDKKTCIGPIYLVSAEGTHSKAILQTEKISLVHFMNYKMLKGTELAVTKSYIAFLVTTGSNYCNSTKC